MELDPKMYAMRQGIDDILSAEYWRKVCPMLHIGDDALQAKLLARDGEVADRASCASVRQRLLRDGFASLPPAKLRWSVDIEAMAEAAKSLHRHGWPSTFLAIYDEAWVMAADASKIMEEATGNTLCMDIVGFLVDPATAKGFSPHRDRQPEDWMPRGVPAAVSSTFKVDGMAKYVTLWAALTDATPENSCLHFIPKSMDPGYTDGDPEDGDPMQRCFLTKDAYQSIRAVPVGAGGCTFHTHRSIHWGSRGRADYEGGPRVALSFGFSTADFEPPYFSQKKLPFPELKLRLALVSAQVLNYATLSTGDAQGWAALAGSMSGCCVSTLTLLHKLFQRQEKQFHSTYRREIAVKFVKVSLDLASQGAGDAVAKAGSASNGGGGGPPAAEKGRGAAAEAAPAQQQAGSDSDDEDEALEAMLSAEAAHGEVLFHDDFDMLNGGDDGVAVAVDGARRKGVAKRKRKGAAQGAEEAMPRAGAQAKTKKKTKRRQ